MTTTPRALARRAWEDPSTQLLLAQLVVAGTAFTVNLAAVRAMDPSGRGQLALLLQVAYLATLALLLGVDRSLVTTYAGAGAGEGLRAAGRLLRRPALVVTAAAVVLAVLPLSAGWRAACLAVAAFALANAALRALRAVAIASGRQRGYLVVVLVSQGSLLATAAVLAAASVDRVPVWVAVYVVVTALPVAVCWRHLARPRPGAASPSGGAPAPGEGAARVAAARREGLVLLPSSVAQAGTLRLDRLLLVALSSPASLGLYASVATMTELLTWPVQAWVDSRLGRWREAHREGRLAVARPIVLAALAVVACGVVLALVLRAVLVPLLGRDYAASRDLVVPLVAAAAVFATAQVVITLLIARERGAAASAAEVVGFVVSLASYAVLIPRLGAVGAAYGSLLGYGAALVGALAALARDAAARRRAGPGRPAGPAGPAGAGPNGTEPEGTEPEGTGRAGSTGPEPQGPVGPDPVEPRSGGSRLDGAHAAVTRALAATVRRGRSPRRAPPVRVRPALAAPVLALLLVAYAGRYGLERAGLDAVLPPALVAADLRLVALPLLVVLVVHELRRRPSARGAVPRTGAAVVPEGWVVAALVFFLYQLGSGLWAPPGARVGATALDVVATAGLTLGLYLLARDHPGTALRTTLWFLWGAGCLYAVAALAAGPGDQGRFSAFGGGPNVFVRVQVLALVALAGLVATGASRWLALSVPVLCVAALLSGSRGGLLAAAAVLAVVLVRSGARARRAGLVALLLASAGAAAALVALPTFADLVSSRFVEQTVQEGYPSQRPAIWAAALALAAAHPLVGAGLDGFHATVGAALGVEYPHNVVLAVLAEGGLVGVALLAVAVASWVAAVRAGRRDAATATMVAAAGYVALASTFSGDYYDARLAWCFAALAAAGAAGPAAPRPSAAAAGAAQHALRSGTTTRPPSASWPRR